MFFICHICYNIKTTMLNKGGLKMKVVKEAISSPYLDYGIDEDIVIH